MDLADFLLARIAEDAEAARAALDSTAAHGVADTGFDEASEGARPAVVRHIARHDPARVLAECNAKRRIVEFYGGPKGLHYSLQFLALPHADHPDYREEWRPGE